MGARPADDVVVLRSGTGVAAVLLAAAVVVALVGQALLLGRPDTVAGAGPWLLACLWAMAVLLARPRVVIARDAVEVVGVLRRHRLPWGAVRRAVLSPQVGFELRGGRTVAAWDSTRRGDDEALRALVEARVAAHEGDHGAAAASRWDAPAVAVTAAVAVLCAVSLVL